MFKYLVDLMQYILNWFYQLTVMLGIPSYFLAIIIFTIVIKVILYPLTVKQMRSMKAMQLVQPKIKEIQEKYKDPQKAQAAMMEVYKQHGANPFSGCLPIVVQMPIFIALFQALRNFPYINKAHATLLWLNLSHPDKFYILPILAGISTFFQQKLSMTNTNDQTQKTMLYVMPIMFAFFAAKVQAGLALYWVVFNVVGTVQQYYINKQPLTLKEDPKENERGRKNR